jgi:uncharacterized protein YlxW (UPF0749 family)
LLIPAALFGFLVTAQWQGQQGRSSIAVRYNAPLTDAAFALQKEQNDLKIQLQDLRAQLDQIQSNAASQSGAASEHGKRLTELKAQAGLSPVTGDGVVVQLTTRTPSRPVRRTSIKPSAIPRTSPTSSTPPGAVARRQSQ